MNVKPVSGKFDINGYPIHYEKFGSGSEVVLLIPGALGTAKNDFRPQLEGPHAFSLKKYTFIGVDLPGWGRSRPPKREYGPNVYNNDSECCFKVMKNLGYKTFSIIGWSDGAKVALTMCQRDPITIKCAVAISMLVQANRQSLAAFQLTRDIKIWPKDQLEAYLDVYGDADTIQLLWDQNLHWIRDAMDMKYATKDNPNQYILKPQEMASIRTPVLLIHGDKDPLVGLDQPKFCAMYIPGAEVQRFSEGAHNCHQVCAAQFKKVVENFIDCSEICF